MGSTTHDKKKHHYVPQHYLGGFTESTESSYIWVYEKGGRKALRTAPKAITFENHFYTVVNDDGTKDSNTFENFLANEIESPAVPILDKIRARQMINQDEKEILSRYFVALLKRVPKHRQFIRESIAPKTIETESAKIYAELDAAIAANPSQTEFLQRRKEAARLVFEQYGKSLPTQFIMALMQRDSVNVRNTLQMMTWRFLTNEGVGQAFLTSDNPFFYFQGMGIGKPLSEVSIPIARDIALWATWRQDLNEGFFPTNGAILKELNRRTVSNAMRYIYSSAQASWIVSLANKRRPQLNMIR